MLKNEIDQIATAKSIFTNKSALDTGYVIGDLWDVKHRDDMIKSYLHHMKYAINGGVPGNLFLYGKYGAGKTMITSMVLKYIAELARNNNNNINCIYIPCQSHSTDMDVLKKIINELELSLGVSSKVTPNSCDAKYARIVDLLNAAPGVSIIVLDEVDKLKSVNRLNSFARIRENKESDKNVCMICITNDMLFTNRLEAQTRSAIGETEIIAVPYDAEQLGDILQDRAEKGLAPGSYDTITIQMCAALAAQEHGDARRAITLLKTAGELCEKQGSLIISENHIRQADAKIEADRITTIVRSLPNQSQLTLMAICTLSKKGYKTMASADIYEMYKKHAYQYKTDPISHRRITDLINELDGLGIVSTYVKSRGRMGRSVEARLTVDLDTITKVLYEERPGLDEIDESQTLLDV